jgi:CMP-N-acetylneuraminic acid synthetase
MLHDVPMTKTYAFVFARGGSKGLPRKNVLSIGGIPMLAHSIHSARALQEIDQIYVSTDCEEIASIASQYGAEVIIRPSELASDTASEWLAWQHAINSVAQSVGSFERFLSLPATSPLRKAEDVQNCLNALQAGVDMVITMTPAHRSPWFNMVTADPDGRVRLVAGDGAIKRRQDSRACFDMTTVAYVSRPEFILKASSIWDGSVVGVEIPRERSIDIDNALDFAIAQFLMEQHELL